METGLSTGYAVGQYFGWQRGKFVRPRQASRFHAAVLIAVLTGIATVLSTVAPIKVTEYSVGRSATPRRSPISPRGTSQRGCGLRPRPGAAQVGLTSSDPELAGLAGELDELVQAVLTQRFGEVGGEPVEHDSALFAGLDKAGGA